MASSDHDRFRAYLDREIAQTRARLDKQLRRKHRIDPALSRVKIGGLRVDDLEAIGRRNSKRRPPGMAPALVEPPRGPGPLAGGAAAPLEFDS